MPGTCYRCSLEPVYLQHGSGCHWHLYTSTAAPTATTCMSAKHADPTQHPCLWASVLANHPDTTYQPLVYPETFVLIQSLSDITIFSKEHVVGTQITPRSVGTTWPKRTAQLFIGPSTSSYQWHVVMVLCNLNNMLYHHVAYVVSLCACTAPQR